MVCRTTRHPLTVIGLSSIALVLPTIGCAGSDNSGSSSSFGGSATTVPVGTGGVNSAGGSRAAGGTGLPQGGTTQASGGNPQGTTASTNFGNGGVTTASNGSGGTTVTVTAGGTTTQSSSMAPGGAKATGGSTGNATTKAAGGSSSATGGATIAAGGTAAGGGTATVTANGHYQMENLDRGVVAVKVTGGVYVGWRMFGYEYNKDSPSSIAYNLYRGGVKLATVTNSTNYLDAAGTTTSSYTVAAVVNGIEGKQSPTATAWAQNYLRIPITSPDAAHEANDGSTGDLDGDGKLDIVLKWNPTNAQDNSIAGVTGNVFLDGYTLAGTRLFRIDLGPNIRAGAHYTQMSVYDLDGDGKAEVACKTAPGTKDGTGKYLSLGPAAADDDTADYRNADGYILTGPEYLTVFDGATGKELGTMNYPVPRGNVGSWGDTYGNRVDRFNGGVAFVKEAGTATGRPSIIQGRGYYTRLTISSVTWRGGVLAKNWIYDSVTSLQSDGAGDHSEMAADTDNDGGQEIITGQTTIDSSGAFKCQSAMGHGDALHVGELIPGKGISVFSVHEGMGGYDVHDGATCKSYVKVTGGGDNGRGVADDVDPAHPGAEMWSALYPDLYSCADGTSIGTKPTSTNFLIYWDADESRELENGTSITKFGGGTLLDATGTASCNGTKSTPTLTADLLGDWREELVLREADNSALRLYTTTAVTARRIYTLMHDPQYRMQVSFENSAYNQPPHPSFHIGSGMADPPKPDIHVK